MRGEVGNERGGGMTIRDMIQKIHQQHDTIVYLRMLHRDTHIQHSYQQGIVVQCDNGIAQGIGQLLGCVLCDDFEKPCKRLQRMGCILLC